MLGPPRSLDKSLNTVTMFPPAVSPATAKLASIQPKTRCYAPPSDNTYHGGPPRSNSEGVIYRGNTSDLRQHFLPFRRQDLHITICGNLGFLPCGSALVPNLHCTAMEKR